MRNPVVEIESPHMIVRFWNNLNTCTVSTEDAVYENLEVNRKYLAEGEYLYTVIVPCNPRLMLALGRDAIYGYVHPEREPFPDIQDAPADGSEPPPAVDSESKQLILF